MKKRLSEIYKKYVNDSSKIFSQRRNQIMAFIFLLLIAAFVVRFVDFGDIHSLIWLICNTSISSVFIVRKIKVGKWNPYDFLGLLDVQGPKAGG
ncbi:MAG: hypothetical protein AB1553_05625 [Nitrospirota bacterium]